MRRHILFDLDGTLTDPMVGITSSVQYALSQFGIEVRYLKDLIPFIGPPLTESFKKFYGLDSAQAQAAVQYYREYFSPKGIYENEIYSGITEMLGQLKEAGFELYIASSKPTVYVKRILKHFQIEDYFTFVVGSELDGTRIQKKDVVSHVLWTCNIPASDAVMVGDRRHDIEGARYCGVLSVGVLYGFGTEEELKKAGASYLVDSVSELSDFLLHQEENREDFSLIRFGIAGTGDQAEKFYQANHFGRGFELTAVYDQDEKKASEFTIRKGQVKSYDDLEAFADCEDIDAVYISGPLRDHYSQASTLMKAGKHVLCQAPLAADLQQTEELFRIAEEENVILLEAVPALYTTGFKKMTGYMRSLGTVRRATLQTCSRLKAGKHIERDMVPALSDSEINGAEHRKLCVCPAACMVRLFGKPSQVLAAGILGDESSGVTGTVILKYDTMIGELLYSSSANAAVPSQIQGEEASMLIREIENVKDLRIFRGSVNQTIHFEQSDNTFLPVTTAFMKMVRTGTGWEQAKEDTLAAADILDKAEF